MWKLQRPARRPFPLSLDDHHTMIGAIKLDGFVHLVEQAQAVTGQEGKDGVEALLQVALGTE